jgi:hypothetical protein
MQINKPVSVSTPLATSISVTTESAANAPDCTFKPRLEPHAPTDRLTRRGLESSRTELSSVSFFANPENEIKRALTPATGFSLSPREPLAEFQSHLKYFGAEGLGEMKESIRDHMASPDTTPDQQILLKQMYNATEIELQGRPPVQPRKPGSDDDFLKHMCG